MNSKSKNKLGTKDFINVGIYTALYFVLQMAISIALGFNPISYMFIYAVTAFVTAPIFMLLVLKTGKKGTVIIFATVMATLYFLMGIWYGAIYIVVFGAVSEMVLSFGSYTDKKKVLVSYVIFNVSGWMMSYSPVLFFRDYWYKFSAEMGSDMESDLMVGIFNMFEGSLGIISFVTTIICSILGGVFGIRLLRKHFEKAGVLNG